MLNREIISIVKKNLNEKVVKIIDSSKGIEQIVKIIITENNKYVIKVPYQGKSLMLYRENFVCQHLKNKLLPKIIFKTDKYLIESFIEGEDLSKLKITGNEKIKLYRALGKNIKKIHQIKMTGFGELQNNGKGKNKTPLEHINHVLKNNLPLLIKIKTLDKNTVEGIKKFLYQNINLFKRDKSFLLHFDLIDGNILVKNNKLAGIIDFGDASCGPVEYDLAKLYIEKPPKIFTEIINGYGKKLVDMEKIKYFAVLHLLYMLPYFYRKNKARYQTDSKLLKTLIK